MPFRIINYSAEGVKADRIVTYSRKAEGTAHSVIMSVPEYKEYGTGESDILNKCYEDVLNNIAETDCSSVAFMLPSAAVFGYPKDIWIRSAVNAFTGFLEEHEIEIILAVSDDNISGIYMDYGIASSEPVELPKMPLASKPSKKKSDKLKIPCFLRKEKDYDEDFSELQEGFGYIAEDSKHYSEKNNMVGAGNLDEALKEIYKDSFGKHLQQLINRKGLKNAQVYAAANISKQYFSKILKDQVNPSKNKLLALAVGLRLNLDETIDFLEVAGYALSPISQTDAVVKYFIKRQEYNVLMIDIVLYDYGLEPLSNG